MSYVSTETNAARESWAARYHLSADEYVAALNVSSNGSLAVAGLGNGKLLGFDPQTGQRRFSVDAHSGGVLGVSISFDGKLIASCGQEPVAKVWTSDGELMRELAGGMTGWVEHVAWAPRAQHLAIASGKQVRIWGAGREPLVESEMLASTVSGLSWRGDGSALAAACYGGVHIVTLGSAVKARHLAWKGSLISIGWSPDAKVIACGSQDASVHFWRLASGRDSQMRGYPQKPKALAWDRESKLLATTGASTVTLWDFRGKGPEGTKPIQLRGHGSTCTQVAFSNRRCLLASGGQDHAVLLWEPRVSALPLRAATLDAEVTALAFHPDGHVLVAADASGSLWGWTVEG
jgi:WD40 repeat protein